MKSAAQEFVAEECDLASIASQAAINLDQLVLNRTDDTSAVQRLIAVFRGKLHTSSNAATSGWLFDPSVAVIVSSAMNDSQQLTPSTLEEVRKFVESIADSLEHAIAPEGRNLEDLRKLRLFCVALSRHAMSSDYMPTALRDDHPFRR